MATAPPVPDFSQFNFEEGDTDAAILKQNGQNQALVEYGEALAEFGQEMNTEMEAAQQARTGAEDAQAAAEQARDEAQQIAVGDVAITDLLPGTGEPGEFVTPDGSGGLIYSTQLKRYDLASTSTADTLDLAESNVFRVDASSSRTLSFANEPGADRAMTVVVHITGNEAVTWPTGIDWDSDASPELGDNETKVVLFWDGAEWSGFVRVAK